MNLRRNALLLILSSVILAILGEWSSDAALAHLWALPGAILLLGLTCEAGLLRRMEPRLDLHAPAHWPLARSNNVTFAFSQQGRRILSLEVALNAPEEFAAQPRVEQISLVPGVETALRLEATPQRLGRYRWPAPLLRIGGAFSLAWWSRRIETTVETAVVPDMADRFAQRRAEQTGGATHGRIHGSGAEILQLREYRAGDPLRAVDWKASARRGHLICREFAEDQRLTVMVAVDAGRTSGLGAGELDRLGVYATVAARLAQRATQFDDAVGLMIFAAQPLGLLAPAKGASAVARIGALLGACRVQHSESNPVIAAARMRAMLPRRSLVVLLTDLEDPASGEQLGRAVRLLAPKHLPFIAALESERIDALPRAPAPDALGAYRALATLEYTQALEDNVLATRALGAAVVTARPEHLDRAVLDAYQEFRERRRV